MSLAQIIRIARAGLSVWSAGKAIVHEGVAVSDPRTIKQAQTLAGALMAFLGVVGLAIPSAWVQAATLGLLAAYAAWSVPATLASTDRLGLSTLLEPGGVQPAMPPGGGDTASGDIGGMPVSGAGLPGERRARAEMPLVSPAERDALRQVYVHEGSVDAAPVHCPWKGTLDEEGL